MTPVDSLLRILLWADTCYALQLRLGLWVVAASLPHRLSTDRALLSPPFGRLVRFVTQFSLSCVSENIDG